MRRNPKRDKAYNIYAEYDGQIANKEIAKLLDVPPKTIGSWKALDKWSDRLRGIEHKEEESEIEKKLTAQEKLFCIEYVKTFNARSAALKAGYSPKHAHIIGHSIKKRKYPRLYIKELMDERISQEKHDAISSIVIQKLMEIAFADIGDYISFGSKEIPILVDGKEMKDEEGNIVTRTVNFIDLKDSDTVDTSLLTSLKQGKDGITVGLSDQIKAMKLLLQCTGHLDPLAQSKVDIAKAKLMLSLEEQKGDGTSNLIADAAKKMELRKNEKS